MAKTTERLDEALLAWATPTERTYLEAVNRHGGIRKAATALGKAQSALSGCLIRLHKRAAMKGYSPAHDMTRTVPDPFIVKGVSTYYNKDGQPAGQWVKSRIDEEKRLEVMREAIVAMSVDAPRAKPVKPPKHTEADLCNLYTMTDLHVGMRAWGKETGADWDLQIAEDTIGGAFEYLIEAAPAAATAIVAQIGDFLHYDSMDAVTPAHKHQLDADSRYSKMVTVAVRTLRQVVDAALKRHARVLLVIQEGNHDPIGSVWLRTVFSAVYEKEPRITVLDAELPYATHMHGATMIGWHHGHIRKPDDLPLLFAAQFPAEWGAAKYRYVHTGHMHHVYEKEHNGIHVIQHPTLAARDAYAARGGWVADRSITGITYHAKWGQVARNTVTPNMLAA